jgi:hypothetical protein
MYLRRHFHSYPAIYQHRLRWRWRSLDVIQEPAMDENYPGLNFGPTQLAAAMRVVYDELIAFSATPSFRSLHAELMSQPKPDRMAFVLQVMLSDEERRKRGVETPDGILFQTSAFGDRRPTLYVIKKFLPAHFHATWENVNITFDNPFDDSEVSRDPAMAWRPPLPVALQSAALACDIPLDTLPNQYGVGSAACERLGTGSLAASLDT